MVLSFEEKILIKEILGLKEIDIIANPEKIDYNNPILSSAIKRLEADEPLAYIVGSTHFMGLKFLVNKSVLIPRKETELLAEEAIKLADLKGKELEMLDLCTGSGAIAVSIFKLSKMRHKITATDISQKALDVAIKNEEYNGLNKNIKFLQSDLFSRLDGKFFDIIVSNPPYIPSNDIAGLDRSVKDFEPIEALDGGTDGLDFIRKIAFNSKKLLKDEGILMFEFGFGQEDCIKEILLKEKYSKIEIKKDYSSIPRIAIAVK